MAHRSNQELRQQMHRQERELKAALEEECGLQIHRHKDKLWNLAWEYGHSAGDNEVRCFYHDIAELLK